MPAKRMRGISSFFEPRSIAVAGVSEDPNKLGSIIFANLVDNLGRGILKAKVYALNPAHDSVGGHPCYRSVGALPEVPELLIVAVPESQTVGLVRAAAKAGVKAAIMITGGYAEVGRVGVEREIGRLAASHGMRILGPNTIGLVDTWSGVDSLFLRPTKPIPGGGQIVSMLKPVKGEIAIVTQSGHLGEVLAEELAANGVGVRAIVGTGNQLDVTVDDAVQYFAEDRHTRVIAVYLEGVHDGRRFMEAAAFAARKKPLVVFKVGKTSAGERAAFTHTASMVGDYDVYRAAFRQAGIIEAKTLQELVDFSVSLVMLPKVAGRKLVIVTNAGGVGAVAADEAAELGLKVEALGAGAKRKFLSEFEGKGFAANASFNNPVDLTASVSTGEFVRAVELATALPECDLALVLPTHHAPGMDYDIARRLGDVILRSAKPVVSCVIGNSDFAGRIHEEFMAMGVPSFPTPERAVRALAAVPQYARSRRIASAPPAATKRSPRRFGRRSGVLPPGEVSRLLRSYGIDEPRSAVVRSAGEVAKLDRALFPAACKLLSAEVIHKTDVGGVAVNVPDAAESGRVFARFQRLAAERRVRFDGMLVQRMVQGGVELILGGSRDPTFGPVVVLGLGGTYTELIHDFALAVAPVSVQEAGRMVREGNVARVLAGYRRGPRVGVSRLARAVANFSRIMVEDQQIEQMEVNPLIASRDGSLAVDARVVLRAAPK